MLALLPREVVTVSLYRLRRELRRSFLRPFLPLRNAPQAKIPWVANIRVLRLSFLNLILYLRMLTVRLLKLPTVIAQTVSVRSPRTRIDALMLSGLTVMAQTVRIPALCLQALPFPSHSLPWSCLTVRSLPLTVRLLLGLTLLLPRRMTVIIFLLGLTPPWRGGLLVRMLGFTLP